MSAENHSCTAYLVRHGATDVNLANPPRLQGNSSDLGLSAEGIRQAKKTAAFLSQLPIAAVISSPLLRAVETAARIADSHGLEVATVDALVEVDVGQWEGMSWIDIEAADADYYQRYMADTGAVPYLGGESFQDVQDRALPALRSIMEEHRGRQIVIVAHNIVNRTCLAKLLHVPVAKARSISQDNCGINVLRLQGDELKVRMTNVAFHLE
jgi:broad specificity phosphatase PhoE